MVKKFIISESEKKNILEMYGLISEQNTSLQAEQSFYASTSPERMLNFKVGDRPANSDFGLMGDSSQENFYFKSTFGDILNRSKSNSDEFLSGFKPLNDMTKYLDYLKIGDEEISGTGEKTFSNLSSNTPIIASHNGLLAIARLMKELKSYKNVKGTTYTIGLGQPARETKRTYFDASVAGNISQNIKAISSIINFYILPTELWKYVDYVNLNDYKNKQKPEIKNIVYNWVNACLVNFKPDTKIKPNDFINQNNLKNIDSLPSLKNKLDSLLSLTLTNQNPPTLPTTANSLWNDIQIISNKYR